MARDPRQPSHNPDNCQGLIEVRAALLSVEKLFAKNEGWFAARFDDFQKQIDRGMGAIAATVEDVRRQSLGGDQSLGEQTRRDLDKGQNYFEQIFGRLRRVEIITAVQTAVLVLLALNPGLAGVRALVQFFGHLFGG